MKYLSSETVQEKILPWIWKKMIRKHESMCHNPFSAFKGWLERVRDHQLGRFDAGHGVQGGHGKDGNDDREVGEKVPNFAWEVASVAEVF